MSISISNHNGVANYLTHFLPRLSISALDVPLDRTTLVQAAYPLEILRKPALKPPSALLQAEGDAAAALQPPPAAFYGQRQPLAKPVAAAE